MVCDTYLIKEWDWQLSLSLKFGINERFCEKTTKHSRSRGHTTGFVSVLKVPSIMKTSEAAMLCCSSQGSKAHLWGKEQQNIHS